VSSLLKRGLVMLLIVLLGAQLLIWFLPAALPFLITLWLFVVIAQAVHIKRKW